MVITALTRNQVARKGSWVRIPPAPPKKTPGENISPGVSIKKDGACRPSKRAFGTVACGLFPHGQLLQPMGNSGREKEKERRFCCLFILTASEYHTKKKSDGQFGNFP